MRLKNLQGDENNPEINRRVATLEDAEKILDIYGYYIENTAITYEYEIPTLE